LVTYSDKSFIVLDQPQKQVLAFQQGLRSQIKNIKWLPLVNSECFFMMT